MRFARYFLASRWAVPVGVFVLLMLGILFEAMG